MAQHRTGSDAASLFASPARLLVGTLIFVAIVFVAAVSAYVAAGWPIADAAYMVTLTIFSVGYGEVRPIATPYLRVVTIATMVLGCTGMIVLTGALVQMFAAIQLRRLLGLDRMQTLIERLNGHVVICGFGRIGVQLAKELHAAGTPFVILERDGGKIAEAQTLGYLCHRGEATEESALHAVRIDRAKILATVLPDDAANVFITLSARNINPDLEIIARGEAPTTESKLLHAGADKVVLPTHIGAERIAEMILYPSTAGFIADSTEMGQMKRGLHEFGLELEMVVVPDKGAMTGVTVGEAERRGRGAFFIVQIDHANGKSIQHPGEEVRLEAQDQVLLVVRGSRVSAGAIFTAPAQRQRTGRTFFG